MAEYRFDEAGKRDGGLSRNWIPRLTKSNSSARGQALYPWYLVLFVGRIALFIVAIMLVVRWFD
jgi:hypothetical protein